jgi:hypothetical protein
MKYRPPPAWAESGRPPLLAVIRITTTQQVPSVDIASATMSSQALEVFAAVRGVASWQGSVWPRARGSGMARIGTLAWRFLVRGELESGVESVGAWSWRPRESDIEP